MRTPATKGGSAAGRRADPKDRLLKDTWSRIGKREQAVLTAAAKVVEIVPAPVDVIDSALAFAVRMLKSQREALVPLLEGVTPKAPSEGSLPSVADAVASAYGLAERVLETQRKALHGLVETVTPPLARHGEKASTTGAPRRVPAGRTAAGRTSPAATRSQTTTRRATKKTP